jgi:hypothetical protein
MHDIRSLNSKSVRNGRVMARAERLTTSQTWLDSLAVLLGIALLTSAYLGWMSTSRAEDNDWSLSFQSLD